MNPLALIPVFGPVASRVDALQTVATDTLLAVVPRDPLATAADVAVVVVGVAVVVALLVGLRFMLHLNRTLKEVRLGVRQNLGPVSDRARSISENVQFITQALRTDVERLNASVKALTERLHQASNHMEERIDEFNALMEVVQGEAEDIFLDTAATVRGVREGARSIGRGERRGEQHPEGVAGEESTDEGEVEAAHPDFSADEPVGESPVADH